MWSMWSMWSMWARKSCSSTEIQITQLLRRENLSAQPLSIALLGTDEMGFNTSEYVTLITPTQGH